jgi:hypothetical protein
MGKAIFDKGIKITNGQDVTTAPTFLTATSTNGTIEKTEPLQFAGNSAGAISGFEITNNGNGTVNIATGIAILRSANNSTSPLVKYTISAQTNISLTDNANNFLLVNYNGGTPNILVTTNPTDINTTTNSIIYVVSRVANTLDYIALIGQNVDANAKLRRRFLNSEGIKRSQGAILTSSNRNLLVTAGLFYSGLIEVTTPAFDTSGADTFTQAYINGTWVRTAGLSQINNTQYSLAGTLTTLPNNSYRVDYVYILADNPSKLYTILGNAHYNNLSDARLSPVPASLPTELQYLGARVGRVIIQKNASTMEVSSEFTTIYASATATLHNDLGGLNVGDYQHLTVAEKSALVSGSGTTNRIPKFNSSNTLGDSVLIQVGGNLGLGSAVVPGELFHIGDGNILLEGGGEVAQKFKRDFSTTGENLGVPTGSGVSVNPIFQIGRIIQAGDGDPEIRIMYSDDNTVERTVFEVDRKGIAASVKTAIGSHFEGFASLTDVNPKFRLNSYPRMRLEMGAGGNNITDVAVERGASGELAFFSNSTQRGYFTFAGNFTALLDAYVNGIRIGKGNNSLGSNTVLGLATGSAITTGNANTFLGYASGNANTSGGDNVFVGNESGLSNMTGSSNTFLGGGSGFTNSSGANNSFIGGGAGFANTTGGTNTFIGVGAGWFLADGTTGNINSNNSVFIGNSTKALNANDTNEIIIGQGTTGLGSNTTIIGNNSTTFSAIKGRNLVGTTTDNGVDALQVTGSVGLNTAPTTSAGGYDILTRNTSTGKVEKVASSGVASTISPTFTGTPTAPTATEGTNTTQIATTAFVLANSLTSTGNQTITGTTTDPLVVNVVNQYDPTEYTLTRGIISSEYSDSNHSAHITGRKSRGTFVAPTTILSGDYLVGFTAEAYNGSVFKRAGNLAFVATGISSGNIATKFELSVSSPSGEERPSLSINSAGQSTLGDWSGYNAVPQVGTARLSVVSNTSNDQTAAFVNTSAGPSGGGGMVGYSDGGTTTLSGDRLGYLFFGGATNSAHSLSRNGGIASFSTENWSGSATGNDLRFYTATNGTTSRTERVRIANNGKVSIGTVADATEVLEINGNAKATSFIKTGGTSSQFLKANGTSDSTTYAPVASPTFTGTLTSPLIVSSGVVRLAQYTVSTLPAGVQGDTAYVTDALAPTYLAVVVGGGAVVCKVFYNGTAWVS